MTTTDKRSVSLPPEVARGVDERVGKGGFSAYAAAAIARQLRSDALNDIVKRMEAEHGPVGEAEVAAIAARFGH